MTATPAARRRGPDGKRMTNADGTTGCYPPGRGFESRRVHHRGPVAQRIEQVFAARRAMFHHPCRHDMKQAAASVARKGEALDVTNDSGTTSKLRVAGSIPAGPPIGFVAQRVEQKRGFVQTCRHIQEHDRGECRRNYSIPSGMTCGVRLPTLQALSGTSGAPGVSSSLSPRS